MILLDTNIIVDLLGTISSTEADWSRRIYARVTATDAVGCNHIIMAEVAAGAARPDEVPADLEGLQIETLPLSDDAAVAAGIAFAAYRQRGGAKEAILPDFLIGGHAAALGASLMTRDRRLARYFPTLPLITPETHP